MALTLNKAPGLVMILVLAGFMLGAGLYAITEFGAVIDANDGLVGTNASLAENATIDATDAGVNLASQLPTVGTIIGVALIMIVVISAFAFRSRMR